MYTKTKIKIMQNIPLHKFHIPVMGLGFSIDTPVKLAHYGIDSVISIVDDDLVEKMRKVHSLKSGVDFIPISTKEEDYRAKRITAYLNLVDDLVRHNFADLKNSFFDEHGEFQKYIDLLPEDSDLKIKYNSALRNNRLAEIKDYAIKILQCGSIDVNIMTKVDKANYDGDEKLPAKFNDAHAALRGYANSKLKSSIVLSAGMNPRLYSYFEEFEDFYPNENSLLNKKIILKVSDYRSALIQGKFLAKKGLWVSEYRIESGLNCGGHAFASDGFLMGPILEEFKINRQTLINVTHEIYRGALEKKNKPVPQNPLDLKITAQGGIGTFEEQQFLLEHFEIDSVGWGTPFLLVPEATNVDVHTLSLLSEAKEEDLYLSNISPLGVPFNSLRGNTKDIEKLEAAMNGKPGSPCPKKFLQFNTEFSDKAICSASKTFQTKKIAQLNSMELEADEYEKEYQKVIGKSCLCVGLATSALKNSDAADKVDGDGVLVCPGPNMAYFSEIVTLQEMVDHICGRKNLISRKDRPNMFIKELELYLNYLKDQILDEPKELSANRKKYYEAFSINISDGINYYRELFSSSNQKVFRIDFNLLKDLKNLEREFETLIEKMISMEFIKSENSDYKNAAVL